LNNGFRHFNAETGSENRILIVTDILWKGDIKSNSELLLLVEE